MKLDLVDTQFTLLLEIEGSERGGNPHGTGDELDMNHVEDNNG